MEEEGEDELVSEDEEDDEEAPEAIPVGKEIVKIN